MLKNIFVFILSLALIAASAGCKKSCDQCQHGGTCDTKGGCSCPDPWAGSNCDTFCDVGMEGYQCQTPSKEKFFGTWQCTSTSASAPSQTYILTLADDSTYAFFMTMKNFNNEGSRITCTLTGKYKFEINQQIVGATHLPVSGYGNLNGSKLTVYINEGGIDYFGTATRQ